MAADSYGLKQVHAASTSSVEAQRRATTSMPFSTAKASGTRKTALPPGPTRRPLSRKKSSGRCSTRAWTGCRRTRRESLRGSEWVQPLPAPTRHRPSFPDRSSRRGARRPLAGEASRAGVHSVSRGQLSRRNRL